MTDLFRLSASEVASRIPKASSRPKLCYVPVSSGSMRGNRKSKRGSIWTAILPWRRSGNAIEARAAVRVTEFLRCAPQNDPGTFLSVGYPNETAMAATKLALAGVLAECPDMKIVWSHLGGGLPMILDRIDRGYQRFSSCHHPPSYYLRRCYFDTACAHVPALHCAAATWGVNTLVFGTDVPHVPNTEKETIAALKETGWAASVLGDIFGATAQRLMI